MPGTRKRAASTDRATTVRKKVKQSTHQQKKGGQGIPQILLQTVADFLAEINCDSDAFIVSASSDEDFFTPPSNTKDDGHREGMQ